MIKKLEIVNVGRFKSAKTDGDSQYFKQNTYIYGKNTFGKSTLAAIFRSVKENCPDIVIGRKTIGAQNQLIKIIPESQTPVGEYRYTTSENVWSNNYKDLIIFDNHFVRENVYTQNQQIGKEQQKSIESFMLGSTGIEYNQQISHLVEKIQGNTKIETAISGEYNGNKHLLGGLPFADFLALTEIVDIDEKIEQTQVELNQIKNAELISNKLQNIKIILERYRDFEISKIEENLQINIDVISEHYRSHINQSEPKSLYEQFLQIGSKLIISPADKRCPFCTQEIVEGSAQEFVKAINAIYNEKYRNLQANLKQAATLFSPSNFLAEVEKNTRDLTQAGHIFTADLSALNSHLIQCDKFINDKIFDLSLELEDSCFASVVLESKVLISCIEKDLAKFANPAEKKMSLEDSVKNLLANKERYSQWQEKCDKYLAAKNENTTLSSQKASLWGEYLEYTGGVIHQYAFGY